MQVILMILVALILSACGGGSAPNTPSNSNAVSNTAYVDMQYVSRCHPDTIDNCDYLNSEYKHKYIIDESELFVYSNNADIQYIKGVLIEMKTPIGGLRMVR